VVGITNIDELSGMADGVQHGEPKLIYSASIDLNDKDYVYKLFVNLGLVVEPDFDDDDFEPVI
jgi:hypothetical protein